MKNTELRNPNSMNIDKMSSLEIVETINNEDKKIAYVVEKEKESISKSIDIISDSIINGGRIFYIGAGTSGRLGVLDASECPPTFGVEKTLFNGIIAGGDKCLRNAAEKEEDNYDEGFKDLEKSGINKGDVVVLISVSGDANYLLGAQEYAISKNAKTIALTCNADAKIIKKADIKIITDTGAEVITGSTRMKAGTAHKMVLNMLSTGSMIKTGKVVENLMINVKPTNVKLLDRAARICTELSSVTYDDAIKKLEHGQSIREIINYKENI